MKPENEWETPAVRRALSKKEELLSGVCIRQRADKRKNESRCFVEYSLRRRTIGHA